MECYLLPGQVWTPRLPEPLCCHVTERPHWGGVPCLPEQAAGRRAGRCPCPLTADLVQGLEQDPGHMVPEPLAAGHGVLMGPP